MTVLVTGGAGFVGANLSIALASRDPSREVIAFDNLKRRGSELNLPRLRAAGVRFVHGDVREPSDVEATGPIDAIVECSAEPSVMAGVDGGTEFVVHTNLLGAYNCLQLARRSGATFLFLSTSRVYPKRARRGSSCSTTSRTRASPRAGSPRTSRWKGPARCTERPSSAPSS